MQQLQVQFATLFAGVMIPVCIYKLPSMQADTLKPNRIGITRLVTIAGILLAFFATTALATATFEEMSVEIDDDEISIRRYHAEGDHLIIWVSPGFGDLERAYDVAVEISKRGIEVWYTDLAESLFLPQSTNTLRALDGRYVAALIEQAHQQTEKDITLMSRSYAALPLLRGARHWQQQISNEEHNAADYLTGAILFSPELYSEIPPLGLEPVFDPIASASNIPIMLYQAGRHGNRWQLDKTLDQLKQGGAPVYLKILPDVTSVFYTKDTSAETLAVVKKLPFEIVNIVDMLKRMPTSTTPPTLPSSAKAGNSSLDLTLKPFSGQMQPRAIELNTVDGEVFTRNHFTEKVTLVNFWASWCGPCVEEIPALNRLRERMRGKPFELISINYAEKPQQVRDFLKLVKVDFPVLLDEDGSYSAKWNVLVYPATFVIATDGRIVYGVNGAIEWDSDEVVHELEVLMTP